MARHILTLSLDATDAYVRAAGVTILSPLTTIRTFRRKFSPICLPNVMWQSTFWNPGGISSIVPQNSSNVTLTLHISFRNESHYRIFLFLVLNLRDFLTFLGILMPSLWVLVQYFDLSFDTIIFLLLSIWGTYHRNAGSSGNDHNVAYSVSCTGWHSLRLFKGSQVVLPYFHASNSSKTFIVSPLHLPPFLDLMKPSSPLISLHMYGGRRYDQITHVYVLLRQLAQTYWLQRCWPLEGPFVRPDILPRICEYPRVNYHLPYQW